MIDESWFHVFDPHSTRFHPTILRIVMFIGEANWPVCTENVKGISCLESTTRVLPGQS